MPRRVDSGVPLAVRWCMQINDAPPPGYSAIPPGSLANVVTCLEMKAPPVNAVPGTSVRPPFELARLAASDLDHYRRLFRAVGEDWLWFSRLVMPEAELRAILEDPLVEAYVLKEGGSEIGLLELDFRVEGEAELAFCGIVPGAIGKGAGRAMIEAAIAMAWMRPIRRFWVHTCTFDHPSAVGFYRRAGFVPYAFMVEVQPDPRLTGHLPRTAAPQVPLIDPGG